MTNKMLAALGLPARWTPEQLRLGITGKNFRTTAVDLCVDGGAAIHPSLARRHPGARTEAAPGTPMLTPEILIPEAERPERVRLLREVGVAAVVANWRELAELVLPVDRELDHGRVANTAAASSGHDPAVRG